MILAFAEYSVSCSDMVRLEKPLPSIGLYKALYAYMFSRNFSAACCHPPSVSHASPSLLSQQNEIRDLVFPSPQLDNVNGKNLNMEQRAGA